MAYVRTMSGLNNRDERRQSKEQVLRPDSRRSNKAAFTLIELLVVIAIIGILAAMLLPALNTARERARCALCVGNLRQLGTAISMYVDDHSDYYPPSWIQNGTDSGDWGLFIGPYLAKSVQNYTQLNAQHGGTSPVFVCPSVRTPRGRVTRMTYSAHGALIGTPTPSCPSGNDYRCISRASSIVRASELILVADGNLGVPPGAPATEYDAESGFGGRMLAPTLSINSTAIDKNKPISGGDTTNYDPGNANDLGFLRWRHLGNRAGNFLFCDGHVETLMQSQVFNKNLMYDP
jgi:prepilin-type N-terminal cleavage/methylation domain-containing protein/prepilin-type processing-associated H-X9-DG protein